MRRKRPFLSTETRWSKAMRRPLMVFCLAIGLVAAWPAAAQQEQPAQGQETSALGDQYLAAAQIAMNKGDYAHAEEFLKHAIDIHSRTLGPTHRYVGLAESWLARIYVSFNRFREAEQLYKHCVPIFLATLGPDNPEYAKVYSNLGETYRQLGRYNEAEPIFKRVMEIFEKSYGPDSLDMAAEINSLAVINEDLGNLDEAERLTKRVLDIRLKKLGPKHPDVAESLHNLGFVYMDEGRYTEAQESFQKALALWRAYYHKDVPGSSNTYGSLANAYALNGQYAEAEVNYRKALKIASKDSPNNTFHPSVNCLLGGVLHHEGHDDEAMSLIAPGLSRLANYWGETHPTTLECVDFFVETLTGLDKKSDALEAARLAVKARIERIETADKGRLAGDTNEQKTGRVSFTNLLKVLARQPASNQSADEAFRAAQYAAGTSTARAVMGMAARHATGSDDLAKALRERQDLLSRWQESDKMLSILATTQAERQDRKQEETYRAEQTSITARLAAIDADLAARFPKFKELSSANPVSIADVQAVLGLNEALVAFTVASDETYAFVIGKTAQKFYAVPLKAGDVSARVSTLRKALDPVMQHGAAFTPFDAATSYALYHDLFGPAEDIVKAADTLIIVPDGALQSLPPSVFVTQKPEKPIVAPADNKQIVWLIRDHALVVEPAISSLVALRRFSKEASLKASFIGFGDPAFQGPQDKTRGVASGNLFRSGEAVVEQVRRLQKLPETADELRAEAKAVGASDATIYLGPDASVSKIKALDLSQANILVFATHGLVAGDLPALAEPALVLTPPSSPLPGDDGLLRASSVSDLKLNADFVVLSACNTAAADGTPGAQALSGLAKAFFYAGARSILVSHWMVDSESTVKLTTGTFKAMAADPGIGRAQALRQSILAMIDHASGDGADADPSNWAPFVLAGEGGRGH